ncbi:GntR family transcriptional regulator [Poriferisphaera sp. WC338]|uniref:GntR family transcriptional regulator n=1 Tax=Poriferisphaera sp. WC338 TaxID=3425129 RepID=UPI003D8147F3
MQPKRIASTTREIYNKLRTGLAMGVYLPGEPLREVHLADTLGVSRTPIREAIMLLEHEGFVEHRPRAGAYVRVVSRNEREALYEMRETLECYAVEKSIEYITKSDLDRLDILCKKMHEMAIKVRETEGTITDTVHRETIQIDIEFHMTIIRCCANPWVLKTVNDLHLMRCVFGDNKLHNIEEMSLNRWALTWRDHLRITQALRVGDAAKAKFHMHDHLRRSTVDALQRYDRHCRSLEAQKATVPWPNLND